MFQCPTTGARVMIIEVEDRFCKVVKVFSKALEKLERAAERVGLRPHAVSTRRLRHPGNATPGGGAAGCEARHAGGKHVVSVAEVERHEVRQGVVSGGAGLATGGPW